MTNNLSCQCDLHRVCACCSGRRRCLLGRIGEGHTGRLQVDADIHDITRRELEVLPETGGVLVVILVHGAGRILANNLLGDGCALVAREREDGITEETGDVGISGTSAVHGRHERGVVVNGRSGRDVAKEVMRIRTERHVAEAEARVVVIRRRVARGVGGSARAVERTRDDCGQVSLERSLETCVGGEHGVQATDDCLGRGAGALELDEGAAGALPQIRRREGESSHDHVGHRHGGLAEDRHITGGINSYVKINSYSGHVVVIL